MDQITHDVRRQNWLNIILQCQNRPSGITVHQWCIDNEIGEKAYYYWLRKFRREAAESGQLPAVSPTTEVSFVEMPFSNIISEPSDAGGADAFTIRKNGMTIEVSNSISGQILSLLLQEVFRA